MLSLNRVGSWICFSLLTAASASSVGHAQPETVSGVTGRVIVDRAFLDAKTIPVDAGRADWVKTESRVRRPAGYGKLTDPTEPAPAFFVVLEGRKGTSESETTIAFEGMRFVPASALVIGEKPLKIENQADFAITVKSQKGDVVAEVPAKGTADVALAGGEYVLKVEELPFVRAEVRSIEDAMILPIGNGGIIPTQRVPEGQYKVAFYYGARPLKVETFEVPDEKLMAVDATVSAKGVVALEIKDASLQVAHPVRNFSPPAPE